MGRIDFVPWFVTVAAVLIGALARSAVVGILAFGMFVLFDLLNDWQRRRDNAAARPADPDRDGEA